MSSADEVAEYEEARELVANVHECRGANLWVENRSSLKELPHSVGGLVWLRSLYARHNCRMTALSHRLANMECLVTLDVCHCALVELPETISQLRHLKTMKLSHNKIAYLPHDFGDLASLECVLLDYNCVRYLPASAMKLFQNLKELNLMANPLSAPSDKLDNDAVMVQAPPATTDCRCGNSLAASQIPYVHFVYPVGEGVVGRDPFFSGSENVGAAMYFGQVSLPSVRSYVPFITFLCSVECVISSHKDSYVHRVVPEIERVAHTLNALRKENHL